MKKLLLAIVVLFVALIVALVIFARLGFIDLSAQVLSVLEKTKATQAYVEVYRQGLQYREGLLNLDDVLAERQEVVDEAKSALAVKEAELLEQEKKLQAKAKDLEEQVAALTEAQKKLTLAEAELAKRDRMAKVYAGMEPEAAAKILLSLDVKESADLLKRMADKDIMEILPVLPPDQAAELGRSIAGQ